MPRRIFFDGTESFWRPENRTGIQRVAREVCRRCRDIVPAGVEVQAVQFDGRHWGAFENVDGPVYRAFVWARLFTFRCRSLRRLARAKLKSNPAHVASAFRFLGGFLGSIVGSILAACVRRCLRQTKAIKLSRGDTLVVVEYPIHRLQSIAGAKARGVHVIMFIYDCVPLSHPEFYRDMKEFGEFFQWVSRQAEGIMTISAFSEQEIKSRLPDTCGPWVDYFHLGADASTPVALRPQIALAEAVSRPCFLMVGTVAPHKNHLQVLDAMERLWARGVDANLLIIGKVGWQADELLGRISFHPELGRRIFIFHELGDAELGFAYQKSHALIAASYIEGFGLPVIESLSRGLPVIASDIAVFREIAGESVEFFPLGNVDKLAEIIDRSASSPRRTVRNWKWLDWDSSTALLVDKVIRRTYD